jgi:CHAT domain-containing protein/tetratricopeptide (TPR) repeat protein
MDQFDDLVSALESTGSSVRERRRILAVHDTILARYRQEGAGAVVREARGNAAAARAVLAPHDIALASVLMVLGDICETIGEVAEAEAADREARGVLLPLTSREARIQLAVLLGNMAVREDGRLDLETATGMREQALSLYREVLPEADERIGTAVQNLAMTWEARDARDAADRVMAEHVMLSLEQGADPQEVAAHGPFAEALPVVLDLVAKRFEREGKLDAAEHFYRTAVKSAEVRRDGDRLGNAAEKNNLALLIERRGRFDEARGIYLIAYDELEAEVGADPTEVLELKAQLMNNIGYLAYRSGDLGSALAFLEAALAVRQARPSESRRRAESFTNLGLVRAAMGDLPAARQLIVAAYRNLEDDAGPQVIDAINNLGWIARATGEAEDARKFYEEALRRRKLLYGDRHPAVAESLNNLGVVLLAAGELADARRILQEGLDLRRAIYGPQHPEVVSSLVNVGNALLAAGDLNEAWSQLMAAWMTHLIVDPEMRTPATSMVLFALAHHAILKGDTDEAFEALVSALDHENLTTASILSLGSERSRLLRLALVRGHLDSLISVALDYSPDPNVLTARVYQQVLRRKATDFDFIAFQRAVVSGGPEDDARAIARDLAGAREVLQRAVHDNLGADILADYRAKVEVLEADLARATSWQPRDGSYSVAEILEAIPADAVLIDFVRTGVWNPKGPFESQWPLDRYVAFVLHSRWTRPRMIDLGDAATIDEAIDAHRAQMLGPLKASRRDLGHVLAGTTYAGKDLRRLILDPLLPLADETRRLMIVPDSKLHLVSFAALHLPDGHHLVDKYELSALSSARDVLDLSRRSDAEASGPPLVVADPDFELADGTVSADRDSGTTDLTTRSLPDARELLAVLGTLPATAAEAQAVGAVLGVEPATGRDADRRMLMDTPRPLILHLATHGFFLPTHVGMAFLSPDDVRIEMFEPGPLDDPLLRCGLVFAGANRWLRTRELHPRAGDGFLTGLDVLGLDLAGTQLVVLSACDTARGEIIDGEGVLGLSRAFSSAGAESLVMSLWKVPDKETADLMSCFYERLDQGAEIPTALRDAQLAIRANHPDPVNWAAFICHGRVRSPTLRIPAGN